MLRPGQKTDAKDVQEFCRTRLASFKRPEQIEFIDALPKNALGKILRKELHAREKGQATSYGADRGSVAEGKQNGARRGAGGATRPQGPVAVPRRRRSN